MARYSKKKIAQLAEQALCERYPEAQCALVYDQPYQLMIAGRLSAQCTDARVNLVTPELFDRYPDLKSLADAKISDVEEIIRPCGLYHTKAESIVNMCRILYYDLNGVIPDSIDELIKLPGIGRKTANLIMGDIHKKPAVVCDTHCIRISNRLGLISTKDPAAAESELRKILPPEKSSDFCHRIVYFGREVCTARKPDCEHCIIRSYLLKAYPDHICKL